MKNDKVLMPDVREIPKILLKTRLQSLSSISKDTSQQSGMEHDSQLLSVSINQTNDFEALDRNIELVSQIRGNLNITLQMLCRTEKLLGVCLNIEENIVLIQENDGILRDKIVYAMNSYSTG